MWPIIEGALEDKAYAKTVWAIGRKTAMEGNVQGSKPEQKITQLQAEITTSLFLTCLIPLPC